ncbi:translational activator of GCN4 [Cryptotrichosporon argae]
MAASTKVGSWLGNNGSAAPGEAYESGSETSEKGDALRDDDDGAAVEGREVDIDWDEVLPLVRPTLSDASAKRRLQFVSRYLYVTDESPPADRVPAVVSTLLPTLVSQLDIAPSELVAGVLVSLVKRDERTGAAIKLGDKLVKWTTAETEKATSGSKTTTPLAVAPHLTLTLALLSALRSRTDFASSPQFTDLLTSLALLVDTVEARAEPTNRGARIVHKVNIRVWRVLRQIRADLPAALKVLLAYKAAPARTAALLSDVIGVTLRLKSKKGAPEGKAIIEAEKDAVLAFYTTNILSSKTALPRHQAQAFSEFLSTFVSRDMLVVKLVPAAERMLLRSPEVALELTASLLDSCQHDISVIVPAKLVPSILASAKSTNADTRAKSVVLFRALASRVSDADALAKTATEVLAAPKTGKSVSAEHRIALFAMIAAIAPSDAASAVVLDTLPVLVGKEGNEPALAAIGTALGLHLGHLLQSSKAVAAASTAALAKELASTKLPARRALSVAIGSGIWQVYEAQGQFSPEGDKLIASLVPALEGNLKTASANMPANAGGFLEGYVALALTVGPLKNTAAASKLCPSSAPYLVTSPKPSFVLNDKAYTKLQTVEDERWFLRTLQVLIEANADKLGPKAARVAIGLGLIYLAFDSKHAETRRETFAVVSTLSSAHSQLVACIVREALKAWFPALDAQRASKRTGEDDDIILRSRELSRLLCATLVKSSTSDLAVLEDIAADFVVLAHHPELEGATATWITLVQALGLDPAAVASNKREKILATVWAAAGTPAEDERMAQAAYRTIATLAFIDPAIYVDAVWQQIKADLDPVELESIGLEERGIWVTPVDQMFVDVLNVKKDQPENKNRKDYAVEKWEQEVRESLAKKKTAAVSANLSKQDRALVAAQLAKEADVRRHIARLQARLDRGLRLVASLADSSVAAVERHLTDMAQLLLVSAFGFGSFLVDQRAFDVFIKLGYLASDKLGETRRLLASVILRSHATPFIPADYLEDPLADQVTRILHQVLFNAEQTPLDSTTYALVSMLLSQIVANGGVGTESPQSEQAQEQLTIVVSVISACVGEFQDDAYPRLQTIKDLLHVIATYSRLAKDATTALADLGAAIKDVATPSEIAEMVAGTLSAESNVRNSALQALQPVDLTELNYSPELFIATHDADEQNAKLAEHVWEDNGLDVPEVYLETLPGYLTHSSAAVRQGCALAIADAAEQYPAQIEPTLQTLQELYVEKSKLLQPEYDRFGMVISETVNRPDPWESRVAIATALEKLSPLLPDSLVSPTLNFLINREALGDRHEQVRRTMLNAAIALVDLHGGKEVTSLMNMLEEYLGKATPSSETSDYIKEAVVILFGRLAGHLDPSDARIPKVVDRLVEALNTPSELVQSAVADCLPALVSGMSDEVEYLVDKLFSTLTTGAKYASRRGAAYGMAGVVRGRGLQSLRDYDLMDKLKEAAEDKGTYQSRQGALFAFETLSATLGKTFEPYIVTIIPLLLTLFGDSNSDVREATQDAARVIMSRISGHCVKLILPTLLEGLEEKQWRTKKGAIELLGAMAFCAPRQLSLSLPTIIPHLTGVINDSHAQVKSAANTSLKRFGEVLENPEVKALQSTLMKALADPAANITKALSALLKTTFEHYLDAPSLALVMPIIDRGLRQRSSETKRKSVQIVGNMASLTESRDLVPYLHELMPLVHDVLVDPVPEARATAAKSLGTLVERLGESNFPDLVDKLLQMLRSDTSGVDRQGAAQGLSEVLAGLGMDRLEGLLPDVISSTSSPRAYVREGFISLLIYLPATFGHRFAPHLSRIIPPILNGLADDSEFVRDASMRAGKMIIANYSTKAIDLLLPELEKGMIDSAWRIRQSSISLTGELLYRVTGISGKVELEEDETAGRGADNARKALLEALGPERRDRVLATLYIVRQDAVSVVRQASIHIWKALVQNTPRTTREILPVLMRILVALLGSSHYDQQETASRTIGELCRKNGERIIGEIVPILRAAITSTDERTKEGACLAFSDVMEAASRDAIEDHETTIIAAVRGALVDSSVDVRAAAARTFDTMQQYMGARAIDQTIPTLLEAMRNPGESSETALQALKEVMNVRANSVFPVLIPTLTVQPISAFNARAIGALVRVAGSALNKRIDTLLGALVTSLEKEQDEDVGGEIRSAIESLVASVHDEEGVHLLEMLLIGWAKDPNPVRRATGCTVFGTMCQVTQADTSEYRVDWIRLLVSLFDDPVEEVVTAAWEALEHFVKTVDKDELEDLVVPLRRTIESAGAPGRHVAGFSRPKGVQSIVPILLAGVLGGTQEQREQAAFGIGDLVQRTSEAAIKPYIIQLTGPLIRVISGQSIAPQIKGAILQTLTALLEEVPQLVRPFHPQLTRTFVKSASDPAALSVRNRAAAGLGELMKHQPRVDPLITELIGVVHAADKDIQASVAGALAAVCASAGKNIGPAAKAAIVELAEEAFAEPRGETYSTAIARVVSGLAKHDPEAVRPIVDTFLAAPTPPTPMVSITIMCILEDAPGALYDLGAVDNVVRKIMASVGAEGPATTRPAREARELLRSTERYKDDAGVQALVR